MTTDDLERPIDPALENRLRRTLNAVAATITHDSPISDGIVQPISTQSGSITEIRREQRKKLFRFRPKRVATLAAAAAATIIAAFAVASIVPGADRQAPEAIALGDGALSQPMRDGGNRCLAEARRLGQLGQTTRPTMVNHVKHPWLSIIIYQTGDRLIYCSVNESPTGEETALGSVVGVGTDVLLRGPIAPELMETQGVAGEYMAVAGRISPRVARVIFDDGAGHTRQANLANGTFATAGSYAKRDKALIISYDDAGKEIDRRPAFGPSCTSDEHQHQELRGTVCEPRDRWRAPTARKTVA